MSYVLWLTGWYPNVLAPFDGDFIQRHARAVSAFEKIIVVHFKKDERATITKKVRVIVNNDNALEEVLVFYHPFKTGIRSVDRLLSFMIYKRVYRRFLQEFITEKGKPKLVHVHVALRAGAQACWFKKKFGVPFIISEHWTGYLTEDPFGMKDLNFVDKGDLKLAFASTEQVTVVSEILGKAIAKRFLIKDYIVIPNVVNTKIFFPVDYIQHLSPLFIHISTLSYQKNGNAIIEAFSLVKEHGYNFRLLIFSNVPPSFKDLVNQLCLQDQIIFKGEVPQEVLADSLKTADALVLYSRYETFGCVVIEANACGVPAILSDIPVFREYINDGENGIFVTPDNPAELAKTIEKFIKGEYRFNKRIIAESTIQKFSYNSIGVRFYALYQNLLILPR